MTRFCAVSSVVAFGWQARVIADALGACRPDSIQNNSGLPKDLTAPWPSGVRRRTVPASEHRRQAVCASSGEVSRSLGADLNVLKIRVDPAAKSSARNGG